MANTSKPRPLGGTLSRPNQHADVEFFVSDTENLGSDLQFKTAAKAAACAIARAISHGEPVTIDVVIWSEAGARWYQDEEGVEQYREDPEASVFERIVIRAESKGRIP